jgi:hypothetical protein
VSGAPRILEFYRADPVPQMRRVLVIGPVLLTMGGLVIAVSFLEGMSRAVRLDAAALGFALIAGGAIVTILGMHRMLREDLYLALRSDGVVVQSASGETLVPWDELEQARWDAARCELVLVRADADPIVLRRPFARIAGRALAERILAIKRKVALNLLH